MKVKYDFIQNGIDGKVTLMVGGRPIPVNDGERVTVLVEPDFYRSDAKPNTVFVTVETNKGVTQRESQNVSGVTGKLDKVNRLKKVNPQLEKEPEKV